MEVDDVSNSFELTHDCLSKSGRTLTIQQRQGVWGAFCRSIVNPFRTAKI